MDEIEKLKQELEDSNYLKEIYRKDSDKYEKLYKKVKKERDVLMNALALTQEKIENLEDEIRLLK